MIRFIKSGLNMDLVVEKPRNLHKSRLVDTLVTFGEEDANLIIESYRRPINPNRERYCYNNYIKPIEIDTSPIPILISKKENIKDTPVGVFIEDYFPDDLKRIFLNRISTVVLMNFTNSLLNHECDYRDTCAEYVHLIMKLTIVLSTTTTRYLICRDLHQFRGLNLGIKLMAIYFIKFIIDLDLMSFFMDQLYVNAGIFLQVTAVYLIPYYIKFFEPYTHICVARKFYYLFKLLIKYGARNLDNYQAYETYTKKNFFKEIYFKYLGAPTYDSDLLINSRIKMRVLQVFIWNRFGNKNSMKRLLMSHLEPYITRQEYEDTFNGFVTTEVSAEQKENFKRESWDWYKEITHIKDDAPVTPRSLQDVCRYVIRYNLSTKGKLPHGVTDLFNDENPLVKKSLQDYLTLENLEDEPRGGFIYLLL